MENTMSEMNEYTPELFELIDEEGNKIEDAERNSNDHHSSDR